LWLHQFKRKPEEGNELLFLPVTPQFLPTSWRFLFSKLAVYFINFKQMVQEILTYIILVTVFYILIIKGFNFFKKPASHCKSCFASKSGCKMAALKRPLKPEK